MRRKINFKFIVPLIVFVSPALFAQDAKTAQITEQMLFADDPKEWVKPKRVVVPKYPPELLAAKIGGYVDIQVTIDERGRVKAANVTKSQPNQPTFEAAVGEVVKFWAFRQALSQECVPIEKSANVRIWFEPEGPEGKVSVSRDVALVGQPFNATQLKPANFAEVARRVRYPVIARQEGVIAEAYGIAEVDAKTGNVIDAKISAFLSNAQPNSKSPSAIAAEVLHNIRQWKFAPTDRANFKVCQSFQFQLSE